MVQELRIITGSCLDLKDASRFHSVITDPPYSEKVHRNATSASGPRGVRHRDLGFDSLSAELRTHVSKLIAQAQRWSVVFSDIEGLHEWISACKTEGARHIRSIPWCRWAMPSLCAWPPQGAEMIEVFWGTQGGSKRWWGPGNLTHFSNTCLRGEGKHKCEKPLDLMLDIVSYFTQPGDNVLDPCLGSGTTLLACKLLGRNGTGYEIDPVWAEKAAARINSSTLSDRDQERYERWLESQKAAKEDAARRKAINDKAKAKLNGRSSAAGAEEAH